MNPSTSLIRIRHLAREERAPAHARTHVHAHGEGQLFLVRSGLVSVSAGGGRWIMPPGHLGWVPPHARHGAVAHDGATASSLYFDERWSAASMPASVTIVRASGLLAGLLEAMMAPDGMQVCAAAPYAAVFADAFTRQPPQTLFLPMPRDARLLAMATALLRQPDDPTGLDGWGARIGMSRRTLTRRFQAETGCSIGRWRQQMRLLGAMERLAGGASVTAAALDMGYGSVSAFIAMFRGQLGISPGAWVAQGMAAGALKHSNQQLTMSE